MKINLILEEAIKSNLKEQKRRPEKGEWEPQISFETFDRCPKIEPQKRTHTKSSCSRANGWLSTSGDDQEVLWNTREPMETNPRRSSENNTFYAPSNCPGLGGGLSAGQSSDCLGSPHGLSGGNSLITTDTGLETDHRGGLSAVCTGLSAGQKLETTPS
jgi:hypothetical protein